MDYAERLELLIKELKISPNKFATKIGKTSAGLYKLLNRQYKKGLSNEIANAICEAFPQVSYLWLTIGKGDMFLSDDFDSKTAFRKVPKEPDEIANEKQAEYSREKDGIIKELKEIIEHQKAIIKNYQEHMEKKKSSVLEEKKNNDTTAL